MQRCFASKRLRIVSGVNQKEGGSDLQRLLRCFRSPGVNLLPSGGPLSASEVAASEPYNYTYYTPTIVVLEFGSRGFARSRSDTIAGGLSLLPGVVARCAGPSRPKQQAGGSMASADGGAALAGARAASLETAMLEDPQFFDTLQSAMLEDAGFFNSLDEWLGGWVRRVGPNQLCDCTHSAAIRHRRATGKGIAVVWDCCRGAWHEVPLTSDRL